MSLHDQGGSCVIAECLVVEVSVTGDDCPLAAAARKTGVTIDAHPPQWRSDGNALLRFSTPAPGDLAADEVPSSGPVAASDPSRERDHDVDPAAYGPVASVLDADDRIRYLHASVSDGRVNYRCLSKRPCVLHELTDVGFMAESLQYRPDRETHTGAVVGYDVLDGVLQAGGEAGDDGGPTITVERIHALRAEDDDPVAGRWSITAAQAEALRTALQMGYFSVPREADAGDVAAELEISKSAFLERLRRGQAALFAQVFGQN